MSPSHKDSTAASVFQLKCVGFADWRHKAHLTESQVIYWNLPLTNRANDVWNMFEIIWSYWAKQKRKKKGSSGDLSHPSLELFLFHCFYPFVLGPPPSSSSLLPLSVPASTPFVLWKVWPITGGEVGAPNSVAASPSRRFDMRLIYRHSLWHNPTQTRTGLNKEEGEAGRLIQRQEGQTHIQRLLTSQSHSDFGTKMQLVLIFTQLQCIWTTRVYAESSWAAL